jgi:hypothetical protein
MNPSSEAVPPSDLILSQKDVKTMNEHLLNNDEDKELAESSTIRKFRIVRIDAKRHARSPIPRKPVSWFSGLEAG